MPKAKVILFKESGKYYTEEEWEVPYNAIGPYDMRNSSDFHRIGDGAVLVTSERWGYPHLFPCEGNKARGETVKEKELKIAEVELYSDADATRFQYHVTKKELRFLERLSLASYKARGYAGQPVLNVTEWKPVQK